MLPWTHPCARHLIWFCPSGHSSLPVPPKAPTSPSALYFSDLCGGGGGWDFFFFFFNSSSLTHCCLLGLVFFSSHTLSQVTSLLPKWGGPSHLSGPECSPRLCTPISSFPLSVYSLRGQTTDTTNLTPAKTNNGYHNFNTCKNKQWISHI